MSKKPDLTALTAAYQATSYVALDGKRAATARIMAANPEIDALIEKHGAGEVVFITAWNPGSQKASAAANDAANARLKEILAEEDLEFVSAEMRPATKDWPVEVGFAVFDLPPADALALAEMFGQYAITWAAFDQPAQLLFTKLVVG